MAPQARESRPSGGGSSDHVDDATAPIVLRDALARLADAMGWMDVGEQIGYRKGHIVGFDLGYAAGRHDERTEAEAELSAELDAHNRWIARTIPQAVEARARRVRVSA